MDTLTSEEEFFEHTKPMEDEKLMIRHIKSEQGVPQLFKHPPHE